MKNIYNFLVYCLCNYTIALHFNILAFNTIAISHTYIFVQVSNLAHSQCFGEPS